jgi:hypothetical protein
MAAVAVAVIAFIVMMIVPRTPQHSGSVSHVLTTDVTQIAEPVTYCVDKAVDVPRGRVQVLVDASGSMKGVRGPVLNYVRWLEQGISRLRDSALGIDQFRIAGFDKGRGQATASSVGEFVKSYEPRGETTLHEAIRASKDWDLTFIITDGVAAAGAGSGDCASGIDAACVARALRDALYVERTSTVAPPAPGIWIIPLWTRHAGVFYTERAVSVADFDRNASLESIHQEIEQDVSITQQRSDRGGNLVFEYTGPRALMMIIISHSADLGRAAIVALRERMIENDVTTVESIRSSTATLGAFPPLELYPGYLPRVEWSSLAEDDNVVPKGTMDVDFVDRRRISVACQAKTINEASYVLTSKWKRPGARCASIYQLPMFEFGFLGSGGEKEEALSSFIREFHRQRKTDGDEFKLALTCGQQQERPCSSNPVRAQWVARPRYDQTGREGDSGAKPTIVSSLTTTDLTKQPHRIYGFAPLLSYFFDEVAKDNRQIVLADIEVCHRDTP